MQAANYITGRTKNRIGKGKEYGLTEKMVTRSRIIFFDPSAVVRKRNSNPIINYTAMVNSLPFDSLSQILIDWKVVTGMIQQKNRNWQNFY